LPTPHSPSLPRRPRADPSGQPGQRGAARRGTPGQAARPQRETACRIRWRNAVTGVPGRVRPAGIRW